MKLPDKLSDLIDLAVTDLEVIEKNPRYKVDMSRFHTGGDPCLVCFAGAIMANTFGVSCKEQAHPWEFPEHTENRLYTLNYIRDYRINDAIKFFHGTPCDKSYMENLNSILYNESAKQFKSNMREIAKRLRNDGY